MLFERRCPGCRRPAKTICDQCWASLAPAGLIDLASVDRVWALLAYDERSCVFVLAAKNHGRRDLLAQFGQMIVSQLDSDSFDVITWVPSSTAGRRRRGYDQGRLLARSISRYGGWQAQSLLRRTGRESQRHKSREERLMGPSLLVRGHVPERVLIVDDVIATGASLNASAKVLREAGARHIVAATVAASVRSADLVTTSYIGSHN